MNRQELKIELLKRCKDQVENRLMTIENTMALHQKALAAETKSSAGDKHETGRAMIQLEMEKASQQLEAAAQTRLTLEKISSEPGADRVSLGNLVRTSFENYYLSVSIGELWVEGMKIYAISPSSPVGKLLLGKRVGEEVIFNQNKIEVLEIF